VVPGAQAATIQVTTTVDSAAPVGACSLRAAILSANTDTAVGGCRAGSGADTILVPRGTYNLTVEGPAEDAGLTGDLDVTADTRILARLGVATIDAGFMSRVLDVHAPAVVVLDGLTLEHGGAEGPDSVGGGLRNSGDLTLVHSVVQKSGAFDGAGGVANSGDLTLVHSAVRFNDAPFVGGVLNEGELTLRNSHVDDNGAAEGGPAGGILSTGSLRLLDSTVSGNTVSPDGSHELLGPGGGVVSDGPLVVRDSEITGNFGGAGAGILASSTSRIADTTVAGNSGGGIENDGVMTISRSSVHDNDAAQGGGVLNRGQLSVDRSAVYANTAFGVFSEVGFPIGPALGGGIYSEGGLRVTNSSIFANRAVSSPCGLVCNPASGGAIASVTPAGSAAPATLVVTASTISQNSASLSTPGRPTPPLRGGGIAVIDSSGQLRGSILAGNTAPVGPDCVGTLDTLQWSLLGDRSHCEWSMGGHNLLGVDPLLGVPTGDPEVLPLQVGSPAIDAGTASPSSSCPRIDQRGVTRPQDGNGDGLARCDIGAYERTPTDP
jgi:CSLREA domain-containing protein